MTYLGRSLATLGYGALVGVSALGFALLPFGARAAQEAPRGAAATIPVLAAPVQAAEADIDVSPMQGVPGAPVTVSGHDLTPGQSVIIGVGPAFSEWGDLARAEVDANGDVRAEVMVPGGFEPGMDLVFVIHPKRGDTLLSEEFQVIGGETLAMDESDANREESPDSEAAYVIGTLLALD